MGSLPCRTVSGPPSARGERPAGGTGGPDSPDGTHRTRHGGRRAGAAAAADDRICDLNHY